NVDCSEGSAKYVEDCPVCCQPIRFELRIREDGTVAGFEASRENE
ncbi:MAG TPA: CPXCG motif-containing cysteine-rich protein, partial [Gammaproteobacteria bacterium]|nr:CPXCG motif-containing cysteine-rich protein [Gammaproteobacteria bacterium]